MRMQITAGQLICVDVLVDPLMTDLDVVRPFEPLRYLFWTPILADLLLHQLPLRCGDTTLSFLMATGHRLFMRHHWLIVGSTPVTAQLTANCRLIYAHMLGDVTLSMASFLKRGNLASLFSGKLRISTHRYSL
jgi:hypothetical protein